MDENFHIKSSIILFGCLFSIIQIWMICVYLYRVADVIYNYPILDVSCQFLDEILDDFLAAVARIWMIVTAYNFHPKT